MITAKQKVQSVLDRLPDNCTEDEILYRLYVATKIRRGLDDLKHGRVKSQEQVEREFEKWLSRK